MTAIEAEGNLGERGEFIRLITAGRTTGLPHIVKVRFIFNLGSFYALSGKGESDWVRNALAYGTVKIRLGEYLYETKASLASAGERSTTLKGFASKYGRQMAEGWYSGAHSCIKLTPTGAPTQRGAARGEAHVETTLSDWRKKETGYYAGVAEAFDSASEEYDYTIRNNFINAWIRQRSIRELLALARPDDVLLEVGCGTGAEAMEVVGRVAGLVATDISPAMIAMVRRKAAARGVAGRVSVLRLGAAEIARAGTLLPNGETRLAYSFNGALNCEPSVERFPSELSKVVSEGGYFVCSVRNTLCLPEALAHGAFLQFGRMAPRKKQPVMVSVGGYDIPSYYYSPSSFAGFFSSSFRLRRTIGLPAILPPAYLSDRYFRARRVLSFAERAEMALGERFPFNRFGDQTLFVFQKK